jgi:hypothetical protein
MSPLGNPHSRDHFIVIAAIAQAGVGGDRAITSCLSDIRRHKIRVKPVADCCHRFNFECAHRSSVCSS